MKLHLTPHELLKASALLHAPVVDEEEDIGPAAKKRWKCRFIGWSDQHIGTKGCRAKEALRFIKQVKADQMCIAGDFIDILMLRRRWYVSSEQARIIQKVQRQANKGTEIVIVPGNHDKELREEAIRALQRGYVMQWGDNIAFLPVHLHVTKTGDKILIIHGDQFDGQHGFSQFWQVLGSHGYNVAQSLNDRVNEVITRIGLPEVQVSAWLKSWVKGLTKGFCRAFNKQVASLSSDYDVNIIGYGHTHTHGDEIVEGVRVINFGCWTEKAPAGCTALIEDMNGILRLVQWMNDTLYDLTTGKEIPEGEIYFEEQDTAEIPICA